MSFEQNLPCVRLDQANKDSCDRGFSATAFADDGERLARLNLEAHIVDSGNAPRIGLIGEKAAPTLGFLKLAGFEPVAHRRTHRAAWSLPVGRNSGTARSQSSRRYEHRGAKAAAAR